MFVSLQIQICCFIDHFAAVLLKVPLAHSKNITKNELHTQIERKDVSTYHQLCSWLGLFCDENCDINK